MNKVVLSAVAAVTLSATSALAADLPVKARPVAAPPPPAFDIAFGSAITSDYIFRGVTQSNHHPSVNAYFEPRYNINADNQLYIGIAGNSISFPNRAAAEIDFYGGWRPTFGKLALDFGAWYYWYPGGQCFNTTVAGDCATNAGAFFGLPNGNVIKADLSFWEVYAKAGYNVTDLIALGFAYYYSPSVLNSGARGHYFVGNAKFMAPALSNGVQFYVSGEVGYWDLGTSDSFYGCTIALGCLANNPNGIPFKSYTTWNIGFGWTYKVFTVDLRYTDTNLSKGDCNAFTGDHTATGTADATAINAGPGSNWCGQRFYATLKADLTLNTNVK
jgi:hypothetical protein